MGLGNFFLHHVYEPLRMSSALVLVLWGAFFLIGDEKKKRLHVNIPFHDTFMMEQSFQSYPLRDPITYLRLADNLLPLTTVMVQEGTLLCRRSLRSRLHEQIKPPLILVLDPYEVTPDKFAQIKHALFAQVNAALGARC